MDLKRKAPAPAAGAKANKVAAIVGLTGSGKTVVSNAFEKAGFKRIRFGDLTDEVIRQRKLEFNEANERAVREGLRKEYGMAAYALLNIPKVNEALKDGDVVVDGLYSWDEYLVMSKEYGERMVVVAVFASPATRYARLAERPVRPLYPEESRSRDYAEIENIKKGGPIAMADYIIVNEGTLEELEEKVLEVLKSIQRTAGRIEGA